MVPPAVAAGHPATCAAGVEILADGGTAADAAVAACLASCVAETVMTGLLGGGFAIHLDAASGRVENLDFFVAVPSGRGATMEELAVPFGEELVHYAIGAASFAVPGVPAGLAELRRAHGRLPWARLVEPALRLARNGVPMPPAHVSCLRMLEPVMTMREGAEIYAPGGRLLADGELLRQAGLTTALELLATEGPESAYGGSISEALLALLEERGGVVTRGDLAAYRPAWSAPAEVAAAGCRFLTRGGLSGVPEALGRLPRLAALQEPERLRALLAALEPAGPAGAPAPTGREHTTNLCAVDADGNACVVTTSLGLGSGDWVPGLDLHLNSMLGESDLVTEPLRPGERMQSMMAPSLALDGDGLALAIGAAGGTRLRTALVGVAAAVLDEGVEPQAAVDRPRAHPAGPVLHCEPGISGEALAVAAAGYEVRCWPDRHHYFGGVSAIGRRGAAADPRRSGAAGSPRP